MLERFEAEVHGQIAIELQSIVANRALELLHNVLLDAVELWKSENFLRSSDGELACTVRIFDCSDRVIRQNEASFPLVRVQYDGTQPTRSMRAGLDDPKKAPRPDLSFFFGSARIHVEAKILKLTGGYARQYVVAGMRRFQTGYYETDGSHLGAMIGYVIVGPTPNIVDKINAVITTEPDFSAAEVLQRTGWPTAYMSSHISKHADFDLHHRMVELPSTARP